MNFSGNVKNKRLGISLFFTLDGLIVLVVFIIIEVSVVSFDHFLSDSVVLDIQDLQFGRCVTCIVEPTNGDVDLVMARLS